eukprot:1190951-Prorocentrum_minimum.AAC.3
MCGGAHLVDPLEEEAGPEGVAWLLSEVLRCEVSLCLAHHAAHLPPASQAPDIYTGGESPG